MGIEDTLGHTGAAAGKENGGELLGAAREDDDTVESYTLRLQEALKLDEIRAKLLARGKLPDWAASTYERLEAL